MKHALTVTALLATSLVTSCKKSDSSDGPNNPSCTIGQSQLIEQKATRSGGLIDKTNYTYDAQGRLTEIKYTGPGYIATRAYAYLDDSTVRISYDDSEDSMAHSTILQHFDIQKNPIGAEEYYVRRNSPDTLRTYEYKYQYDNTTHHISVMTVKYNDQTTGINQYAFDYEWLNGNLISQSYGFIKEQYEYLDNTDGSFDFMPMVTAQWTPWNHNELLRSKNRIKKIAGNGYIITYNDQSFDGNGRITTAKMNYLKTTSGGGGYDADVVYMYKCK